MKEQVKLRDFTDIAYKDVHDIVFPADVRETDLFWAEISRAGTDLESKEARIWRFSPLGVELVVDEGSEYSTGETLSLTVRVGRQTTRFEGIVVATNQHKDTNKTLVGVRLHKKQNESVVDHNRRSATRWVCSSQFHPVAVAPNPVEFNDFVYITVRDISASGIRALTSLRNKFIVPGMHLEWQMSFPLTGHTLVKTRVARASLTSHNGKDYLELGMEMEELGKSQKEVIGQYLVQFSDADSLEEIRKQGFSPVSLTKGIDYSYIKSEEDFREVLNLRLISNRVANKVPEKYSPEDMSDIYDSRSRIIVGRYKSKIVGTVRLTLVESDQSLEAESFIQLPDFFPRRDQIVECSRAATDPNYRRGDLWYSLIQHVVVTALQAKRHFAVASTTSELLPMYAAIGFRDADLTYIHPLYPDKTQHLLYASIPDALAGKNVSAAVWNVVWKKVADYVEVHGLWHRTLSNTRTKIYRLLGPIAMILAKRFKPKS